MIFVVSGPSGSGKSTLVSHVLGELPDTAFSVSHTTRPPRDGEQEGKDYYFVDQAVFDRMVAENRLVEWAMVHGHCYGTSKYELEVKTARGADVILDIDVQGARQIKANYKKGVFIFVLPPSFTRLKERLINRGSDPPETVRRRLAAARKEVRAYSQFDYIVINDQIEAAQRDLAAILRSERCRLKRSQKNIIPILRSFMEAE